MFSSADIGQTYSKNLVAFAFGTLWVKGRNVSVTANNSLMAMNGLLLTTLYIQTCVSTNYGIIFSSQNLKGQQNAGNYFQ